ncbi:hypothetical protein BJX76DRAFT_352265 [Aspergillus varians]
MPLSQPKVTPLPSNINLNGKTAVITGATAGLGLETARQLLRLNISTLVLAVRNLQKGKACVTDLLNDKAVMARASEPKIHVLELDMELYESVQRFSKKLTATIPKVDILILNAGICIFDYTRTKHGHERTMQVNYWSNVLLVAEMIPYLEASADKTGSPVRITWVGSRRYYAVNSLENADILKSEGGSVTKYMDAEKSFVSLQRYADSKLIYALFFYALAPKMNKNKIILNSICPGMVKTNLASDASLPVRLMVIILQAISARTVEVGASLVVNAAVVAGPESHGELLGDKDITEPLDWIKSERGKAVQKQLWVETVKEIGALTTLPSAFA